MRHVFSKKNIEIAENIIHFSRVHLPQDTGVEDPVEQTTEYKSRVCT
jgi:hypothetical protein